MRKMASYGSVLEMQMAAQSLVMAKAMVSNSEALKHLETVGLALDVIADALSAHVTAKDEARDSFAWLERWAGEIFKDEEALPHVKNVRMFFGM